MPRAATAFVEFEGDFSKIQRGAGAQARGLEKTFNSSFKRIARFAAVSLAGVGVGKVLKDSFKEAEQSQKIAKQTAAVIKSTGGAARVSSKQVDKLATSLSNVAGIDDEVIASGENVLLTFTNVRNEVGKGNDIFTQATEAAVNLSAALGTDLQGSVIQIGKSLNDPIKGVTALQRVGVSFTKQQKDQIKTLVDSGRTLDAQKLILRELSKEFGGAAAAAATPSQKIAVAFKNIEEALGGLVLPLFEKLASFVTVTLAPALERVIDVVKNFGTLIAIAFKVGFSGNSIKPIHGWLAIFAKLGAAIRGFIDFIRGDVASAGVQLGKLFGLEEDDPRVKGMISALTSIRKAIGAVVEFIARNWKPLLIAAAAALLVFTAPIVAVIAGLAALYIRFRAVRVVVAGFITAVKAVSKFLQRIDWAAIFERVAADVSTAIGVVRKVIGGIVGFFQSHKKDFEAIGAGFVEVWRQVAPTVKAAFDTIVAVVRPALAIIVGVVTVAVNILRDLWDRFGRQILDKLRIAFNAIVQVVRGAFQVIQGIFEIITGILTLDWSKTWEGIKDVVGGVVTVIVGQVKGLVNLLSTIIGAGMALVSEAWHLAWEGIKSVVGGAVNAVVGFFAGLPGRILAFAGAAGLAALGVGAAILSGIKAGLTGAVGFVTDIGKAIANAAIRFVNTIIASINRALEFSIHIPGGGHFGIPKSIGINPPDIPPIKMLGSGGVIRGPVLGLLGEDPSGLPEIVTPERLMRQIVSEVLAVELRDHPGAGLPPLVNHWNFNGRPVLEEVEAISRKQGMAVAIRGRG